MSFQDPGAGQDDAGGGGPPSQFNSPPPQGGGALPFLQQGPQPSAPGPGDQANSMNLISTAIGLLQKAQAGFPPGSPQHKDVVRAVQSLSRHMAQGQPAAGVQRTQIMDLLQQLSRSPLLAKIMQGMSGNQGGDQGGPAPPSPAPMPSTPLPGA